MATFIPNVTDQFPEPSLYRPDFSFLDTMLRRKQAQYDQGFAELAGKYKNISRSVTNAQNAEVRDTFIKQAMGNLKNLSAMDLSQQQNVQAASSVFQPFYKNTNVLGDMALTAHWDQQEAIGDSFRLKDGGKEYSQDNVDYIRKQRQQFAQSNPDSWKEFYSNRRSYTPYWDWNKEMKDALKEFKPSHTKLQKVNGMWLVTTEDSSWTQDELSKYLDATLSDKAKQQMKIEASVRYSDNPQVLGSLYMNEVKDAVPIVSQRLKDINTQLKVERDPEKIKVLNSNKKYYEDKQTEIEGNVKNIQAGDVSFLKGKADSLAYQAYYNQNIKKVAAGYAHTDVSQTLEANQVAMMYAKFDHDFALENYKKKLEVEKGITDAIPINDNNVTVETTLDGLKKTAADQQIARTESYNAIKNVVSATYGKSINDVSFNDVQSFINNNPNHQTVRTYNSNREAWDATQGMISNWDNKSKQYAYDQLGGNNFNAVQDYKKAKSTTNPWEANRVADKYKLSLSQLINLEKSYDETVSTFNNKTQTATTVGRKGFVLQETDPRQKQVLASIEALTGNTGRIGVVKYYPKGDGTFDIGFDIKDLEGKVSDDTQETLAKNLKASIQNTFKGIDVSYDKNTRQFTAKNLGNLLPAAARLNPYNNINPTHSKILYNLENSFLPPSGKDASSLMILNGKAGSIVVGITKLQGYGNGNDANQYQLNINGIPVNQTFSTSLRAYTLAQAAVDDPNSLNALLK